MDTRRRLATLGVALALATAGCGGSGASSSSYGATTTSGPTASTAAGGSSAGLAARAGLSGKVNDHGSTTVPAGTKKVEVELDDYYLSPTYLQAAPGTTVTLELKNAGSVPHTFTSDRLGVDQELAPGDTAEVTVTVPASGAAPVYCRFHRSSGMQGALVVQR